MSNCVLWKACEYDTIGALSGLEANHTLEEVVVCHSELSEMLLAKDPRHTPVHHLGIWHAQRLSDRGLLHTLHIVQLPLEPTVARPALVFL